MTSVSSTGNSASGVRGFDPANVERRHIRPITVLYGQDSPGIELRIARFVEVLREAGEDVVVFPNGSESLGYVTSGDMFSDCVCVVIKNASDLAKSTADAKKNLSVFLTALSAYDDASTFVLGVPSSKDTKNLREMLSSLSKMGAMCREVKAPVEHDKVIWAVEYAKSIGKNLSEQSAAKAVEAAAGDLEGIQAVLDEMIYELRNLGVDEIRDWIDATKEADPSEFRRVLLQGDADGLMKLRGTFPKTAAGYRSFLLRLRHALFDMVLVSVSSDQDPYTSFKRSQYGYDNVYMGGLSALMRQPERMRPFQEAYHVVNREIEAISGAAAVSPSYSRLIAAVAACAPQGK